MSKVNFGAKYEYEKVKNYKVLQSIFDKQGVPKVVDTHKLIKGKPMDNLEFFQWMKHFFDSNFAGEVEGYDALNRRKGQANKRAGSKPRGGPGARDRSRSASTSVSRSRTKSSARRPTPSENAPPSGSVNRQKKAGGAGISASALKAKVDEVKAALEAKHELEIGALRAQIAELELTTDALERERDFYFAKLRDVEILAETHEDEDVPFLKDVQAILYQTDDADDEVEAEEDNDDVQEE